MGTVPTSTISSAAGPSVIAAVADPGAHAVSEIRTHQGSRPRSLTSSPNKRRVDFRERGLEESWSSAATANARSPPAPAIWNTKKTKHMRMGALIRKRSPAYRADRRLRSRPWRRRAGCSRATGRGSRNSATATRTPIAPIPTNAARQCHSSDTVTMKTGAMAKPILPVKVWTP